MKVIIAGSRSITDYGLVKKYILEFPGPITEIVSGGANGVDKLGIRYAREKGIPFRVFLADWEKFGKAAGFRRNLQMAKYVGSSSGCLLAIWNGDSHGTANMIQIAAENCIFTIIHQVRKN